MDCIREESSKDATLQLLTKYVRDGWPTNWKKLSKELHPYWNYQDELSMEDRILLKSYRILIPYTMWMEMLDLIHEGHQGMMKCLLHSRESLFWPGISNEIHQTVDKCGICQATSTAQRKLPSVPSEIPPHAWNTLGTDLFYWKHFDFLVLGDYFSKFLIVRKLPSSTSSAVCKEIFQHLYRVLANHTSSEVTMVHAIPARNSRNWWNFSKCNMSQVHLTFPNLMDLLR